MKNFISLWFLLISLSATASRPFQYVSPIPNGKNVTVEHAVLIRPGELLNPLSLRSSLFTIDGNKSGRHQFTLKVSADHRTVTLLPASVFAYDERVTIKIKAGIKTTDGNEIAGYEFSFSTHREYSPAEKENFKNAGMIMLQEETKHWGPRETVDAGTRDIEGLVTIDANNNPAPGDVFFDSFSGYFVPNSWTGYNIVSSNGDSLFQRELGYADDFKLLHGGLFAVYNGDYGRFDVLDSNFNVIDKYYGANGYTVDNHEMQMLLNGHVFIIAQEFQVMDMTVYDPDYSPNATIFASVIQEFDEEKNLVFEWRAFDHVSIPEALHEFLGAAYIDYMHTNALEIDMDGNILASHRHLDQITKIDRNTGEFIWRLGGVMNEFTFINENDPFTYQHDIRRLPNGNITLYDNGNWHAIPHSTAKEYQLDEVNKTATLVWKYSHPDGFGGHLLYFAMGSVQRLSNGNTFINWGWRSESTDPSVTEVTSQGVIVWEMTLQSGKNMLAYRAHKYEYNACARPTFKKMRAVNVKDSSATLTWFPAWNAVKYELQYSKQGSGVWTQKIIPADKTSKAIKNLSPNSVYQWKLQTWCDENGNTKSGFTSIRKFQTPPQKILDGELSDLMISVFPNPASNIVTITHHQLPIQKIRVINLTGQEVMKFDFDKEFTEQTQFSVEKLSAGSYFIELSSNEWKETKPLIVE